MQKRKYVNGINVEEEDDEFFDGEPSQKQSKVKKSMSFLMCGACKPCKGKKRRKVKG